MNVIQSLIVTGAISPHITTPTLMVHSDGSALPDNACEFYTSLSGEKQLSTAATAVGPGKTLSSLG